MKGTKYKVVCLTARPCGLLLLQHLLKQPHLELVGVFTHSKMPSSEDPGRNERPEFKPIQELLKSHGVPLCVIDSVNDSKEMKGIEAIGSYDFLISLSWRFLVSSATLKRAKIANINLHRGLLPKYGGAEPVRRMLVDGLTQATITAHIMEEAIDTGEILREDQHKMSILPGETPATAAERVKKELDPIYPFTAVNAINKVLKNKGLLLECFSKPALLIDLDGTLANSLSLLRTVYNKFLVAYGKIPTDEEFEIINGPPLDECVSILKDRHKLPASHEHLFAQYSNLISESYNETEPNNGAFELLTHAKSQGWLCSVVTSNSESLARNWLKKNRLLDLVDLVVGKEAVKNGKPHPDPYLAALDRLGCSAKDSLAIEDSKKGIESAKSAGLKTLEYNETKSLGEFKAWLKNA